MSERDEDGRAAWRHVTDLFLSPESHDRFHTACKAAGLPHPGALRLLLQLRRAEPPTMGGLAGFLSCDASYATALVDALESLGYVRAPHVVHRPTGEARAPDGRRERPPSARRSTCWPPRRPPSSG